MKKLMLLTACLVLVAALTLQHLWQWWHRPLPMQGSVVLTIDEGSSLRSVALHLAELGALQYPGLWQLIIRVRGLDSQIKSGEYDLGTGPSPADLLAMLVAGRVVQYGVTLPEGITLADAIAILQARTEIRSTLGGDTDSRLLILAAPHDSAEGLFFPDTYFFPRGASDYSILSQANQRMRTVLQELWEEGGAQYRYETPYELLIMASIVEKETGLAAERERIAGVFTRRLGKRMRLQTDPTVIYGLGPDFDGNLTRRHLQDESNPYNTYRHHGLPPTPIALPGLAALRAAMYPAPGSELYFVARGDGSHAFSDTLEQHLQAVKTYQLRRAKNYRSTPHEGKPTQ